MTMRSYKPNKLSTGKYSNTYYHIQKAQSSKHTTILMTVFTNFLSKVLSLNIILNRITQELKYKLLNTLLLQVGFRDQPATSKVMKMVIIITNR